MKKQLVSPASFNALLDRRLSLIKATLASKAQEYAKDADRLHNFNRAAEMLGKQYGWTPVKAMLGMWSKHLVSVIDMANEASEGKIFEPHFIDEKIGDAINYLILMESLLKSMTGVAEKDGVNRPESLNIAAVFADLDERQLR